MSDSPASLRCAAALRTRLRAVRNRNGRRHATLAPPRKRFGFINTIGTPKPLQASR